jgi:hypothetical protein
MSLIDFIVFYKTIIEERSVLAEVDSVSSINLREESTI